MLAKIDRWGLESITGRKQFWYGELRKLITAENIVNAYTSRARANDWAAWARDNSVMAQILADVEKMNG